ncbi:histone deacetylase 2-like isoform X1 [Musa acuminata AAA Group]|uniref:histone deacetylase 2-like isoform X1 n=1 Tax=Musa acuminata AAA Group TaxID=214697 RepID=UPI0031CE7CE1
MLVVAFIIVQQKKESGTKTKEYLDKLDEALEVARNDFDPELVVYNAGTDVLGDPLGRLKVCPDGVSTRDESLQICQGKKYTTCYAYIRWLYEVER